MNHRILKLLIFHLHFNSPYQGGPQRSYYIASELVKKGVECEVITAHNQPEYLVQIIDGMKVHFLPVKYENKFGFLKRIFAFWKYNRMALHLAGRLNDFDLAYCISTPLTTGLIGMKLKKRFQKPYVFEVGDLWPDAPIQMGVIKNKWLVRKLRAIERKIYKESAGIVSLSPPISSAVAIRSPKTDIITIPNFADIEYFSKTKPQPPLQFFKDKSYIITASGAIGKANELDFFIHLARYCEIVLPEIGFVMMGDGSEKDRLQKAAENLSNIYFLPMSPKSYVREVLQSSNAIYVSYKQIPVLETGSPNKFFDGLAAGKLIITNFGGWITELIQKHRCGFTYNPLKPDEFEEKIRPYLEKDETLSDQVRKNSLELAEKFRLERSTGELHNFLLSRCSSSGSI